MIPYAVSLHYSEIWWSPDYFLAMYSPHHISGYHFQQLAHSLIFLLSAPISLGMDMSRYSSWFLSKETMGSINSPSKSPQASKFIHCIRCLLPLPGLGHVDVLVLKGDNSINHPNETLPSIILGCSISQSSCPMEL